MLRNTNWRYCTADTKYKNAKKILIGKTDTETEKIKVADAEKILVIGEKDPLKKVK